MPGLSKVEYCRSKDYKHGAGYSTEFQEVKTDKERKCFLVLEGNVEELSFTITVSSFDKDPDPKVLLHYQVPDEDNPFTIRLFNQSRSMDIRLDPKPRDKSAARYRAEGDYWSLHFLDDPEWCIKVRKGMLRRVEYMTLQMPDAWFRYRNYFTSTPNTGNEDADDADGSQISQQSTILGQKLVDFGGGITVWFTGCLASPEWYALTGAGPSNVRSARRQVVEAVESDPGAAVTRQESTKLGSAFTHTSMPFGRQPAKGT